MSQTTTKALPNSPEQRVLTPIFSGVAKIVAKERYRNFCRLTIRCPEIAARAQPGQFVNLYLDGLGGGASFERSNLPMAAILPRPFSVAKIVPLRKGVIQSDEPQAFSVLFDIRGVGTNWLAQLTTDVPVRVSGPLGKGFWLPEGTKTAVLVAGGIGIAPFPFLAERLKAQGVETSFCLGRRQRTNCPLTQFVPNSRFCETASRFRIGALTNLRALESAPQSPLKNWKMASSLERSRNFLRHGFRLGRNWTA